MAHDQTVFGDVGEALANAFDSGEQIGLIFRPADKRGCKRAVSAQTVNPDVFVRQAGQEKRRLVAGQLLRAHQSHF